MKFFRIALFWILMVLIRVLGLLAPVLTPFILLREWVGKQWERFIDWVSQDIDWM